MMLKNPRGLITARLAVFGAMLLAIASCAELLGNDLTPRQSIVDVRIKWQATLDATKAVATSGLLDGKVAIKRRLAALVVAGGAAVKDYDTAAAGCTEDAGRVVALPGKVCNPVAYGYALSAALGFVATLGEVVLANGGRL